MPDLPMLDLPTLDLPTLDLKDVSRSLGRIAVLNRASLSFPSDLPTAVLGLHPGARDAFLRLLAGADRPEAGTIRLGGAEVSAVRREKGRIVRVSALGAKLSGRAVSRMIGAEAAVRVGLSGKMNTLVKDLDLDHRIRLAIAEARAARPSLILLEAPAAGLSGDVRERFVGDLHAMLSGVGAVVVLVAGSADEASGLDGHVLVLDAGRVVQFAPADVVFGRPANLHVAQVASYPALNTVAMMVRGGAGVLADGSTFQPPDEAGAACFGRLHARLPARRHDADARQRDLPALCRAGGRRGECRRPPLRPSRLRRRELAGAARRRCAVAARHGRQRLRRPRAADGVRCGREGGRVGLSQDP